MVHTTDTELMIVIQKKPTSLILHMSMFLSKNARLNAMKIQSVILFFTEKQELHNKLEQQISLKQASSVNCFLFKPMILE